MEKLKTLNTGPAAITVSWISQRILSDRSAKIILRGKDLVNIECTVSPAIYICYYFL